MKTILIPTDFSENAWNAMQYAAEVFKEEVCKYILANAYMMPVPSVDSISTADLKPFIERSETGLSLELDKMKMFNHHPNTWFVLESVYGDVTSVIKKLAIDNKADYVVMGTKGSSGINEVLMGSNTSQVIKDVSCPVLCIPENSIFKTPKKIVLAADYKNISNEDDLLPLKEFAKKFGAETQIVHVRKPEDEPVSVEEAEEGYTIHLLLDEVPHNFYNKYTHNVEQGIQDFAHEHNADVIVMLKRNRNIWESIFDKSETRKMAFHTDLPLLVLHESKK